MLAPQAKERVVEDLKIAISINHKEKIKKIVAMQGREALEWQDQRLRMPAIYYTITHTDPSTAAQLTNLLLDLGNPLQFRDLWSNTLLFYCTSDSHLNVFSLLTNRGIPLQSTNCYGQTVLFLLAQRNCIAILKWLIEVRRAFPIDSNIQDQLRRNALFYAAEAGHQQACRLLLILGSEMFKDCHSHYPMYYARKRCFDEVDNFLGYHKERKRRQKNKGVKVVGGEEEAQYYNLCYIDMNLEVSQLNVSEVVELLRKNVPLSQKIGQFQRGFSLEQSEEQTWQERAAQTVERCLKMTGADFFAQPVDEQEYGISGYYQTILQPMDFGTILKKLTHNVYASPFEFADDVDLIGRNCVEYNGEDHLISRYAMRIVKYFHKVWLQGQC